MVAEPSSSLDILCRVLFAKFPSTNSPTAKFSSPSLFFFFIFIFYADDTGVIISWLRHGTAREDLYPPKGLRRSLRGTTIAAVLSLTFMAAVLSYARQSWQCGSLELSGRGAQAQGAHQSVEFPGRLRGTHFTRSHGPMTA
ncbi:uncharacterized protein K452DRAFT_292803 [Aplosporella prunicola CBS 121167]|uniref:Uncharacterized protein n=1 Tax=Aplosporella prunicola CBS 121167 TaxID=1176127 RepID=A0A6A6AY92_9PEZI|nr:uncharacterized protein K452DRAFT_292803 [Aplosporella prunicola CBS 121167]KAF2135945.1 hypothetical protein K452DRAFT_292803 [Aplosporella prunicola CBS 121167]